LPSDDDDDIFDIKRRHRGVDIASQRACAHETRAEGAQSRARPQALWPRGHHRTQGEQSMSDLLVRNIPPALRRQIKERAKKNRHSLSDEVKLLIQEALAQPSRRGKLGPGDKFGTYLFSLLEDEYRSDDLVFEARDYPTPPDFA
jgi:hypothetical protein